MYVDATVHCKVVMLIFGDIREKEKSKKFKVMF